MKLLFISVRADFGGGPKHINDIINSLTESNFELYLACPNDKPYYYYWKKLESIKGILVIPHRSFSILSFFSLCKFIRDNDIELIHSHGKGAGIYSRFLSFWTKIPVVHTTHGLHLYSNKGLSFLYKKLEQSLSSYTRKIVTVSRGEFNLLEKIIGSNEKLINIYNGITDPKEYYQNESNRYLSNTIITITRYDFAKNMKLCLEIVRCLKSKYNFIWIGDGPERQEIESIAKSEALPIEFIYFTDNVFKYLRKSFIYLSTSRSEGLPYSLIEASAMGIPIVATNVRGNNEVVIIFKIF